MENLPPPSEAPVRRFGYRSLDHWTTDHNLYEEGRIVKKILASSPKEKKDTILAYMRKGHTANQAVADLGISRQNIAYYRRSDPKFKEEYDRLQLMKKGGEAAEEVRKNIPDFPEFCEKYLGMKLFPHQLQWYDLLEGREPRDLHPNQIYRQGDPGMLIVNTPPEHCATVDTPIFTREGWKTVGEVQAGDHLPHRNGGWYEVLETWMPDSEVEVYEVEYGDGQTVRTDAGHKWIVQRSAAHAERLMTTEEIMNDLRSPGGQLKWRIKQAAPIQGAEVELPIDPYILGYWLGDGETGGSRFACEAKDLENLESALSDAGYPISSRTDRDTYLLLYPKGLRTDLRKLGVMDEKRIPVEYELASIEQRMELLRGLLDSDGTISAKDGRVKFAQDARRAALNTQVYRLIASLGFQPRMKAYQGVTEISFKPDSEPVFRLARKAERQFTRAKNRRTDFLTIKDVRPAGKEKVKCLTVLSDDNTYLLGDNLVSTHNAKSTTITVAYSTWRICQDPNIRIIIVSQTQEMAKRFLRAIKDRLAGANPAYKKLQADFAPQGGFDANSASWTADSIYVNAEARDSGEATPTAQALGINGQIYGNRADLIIFDDTVTGKNAHEAPKQIDWIQREVINRLTYPGGTLLLVGTRLAPVELYSEIQKPEWYGQDEVSPWTYLTQPAVLEFAEDPDDWVVLAPWSNRPPVSLGARKLVEANEDGLYPWHSGKSLARRRATSSPQNWAMVYQQEQVSPDAIFNPKDVLACVDKMRAAGPMSRGAPGHRQHGMDGLHVIAGFDPALTGNSAAVVIGVDRQTGMRWVLDVWTKGQLKPEDLFDKIKELTTKYGVNEWVIEKNAMNLMVSRNADLRAFLATRGCLIREAFTNANKWDADFGVASMSSLFEGAEKGRNLIRLPSRSQNEGIKMFIEQLTTWEPMPPGVKTKKKTDCVMALWFAEQRIRDVVNNLEGTFHVENIYLSERDKAKQVTIDLDMAAGAMTAGGERLMEW